MKLYGVSTKCGRSPFQLSAYVEASTPKEAIEKFNGGNPDEELRYRAYLTELPENFWDRADYMREDYIK